MCIRDRYQRRVHGEVSGVIKYEDIVPGKTVTEQIDPVTGKSSHTISDHKTTEFRPRITLKDSNGRGVRLPDGNDYARYALPVGAVLMAEEGDEVHSGDVIAKLPRATTKTKDITGGLPRVCLLYTSPSPRDLSTSRMPSSA
eukprot:TRINITY_DN27213_c0_g1_i1.p1 TRINITY_DN27213_c0_g1~~TRINITY_DN27213_c0_g1_i1.p1  ORF type:complete len:142 (+),score=33.75 TRINITY_DN27213_c0_g1_i1:125-550(+)